jgi:hypothetical protein
VTVGELEAELKAILVPYEDVLEASELHGMEVLHRRGAKLHDWFVGVRPGREMVRFMLLPIEAHPELLDGLPHALAQRKSDAGVFTLRAGDEALLPAIEALVARSFDVYIGRPPNED